VIRVATLGPAERPSPLGLSTIAGDELGDYIREDAYIRYYATVHLDAMHEEDTLFEKAGPREKLYFDPAETRAAIVTCGGLSPGLNNVIRSAFLELHHNYKVKDVVGIRYGYKGLNPENGLPPLRLTTDMVDGIDKQGGTILGTSRGREDVGVIVSMLEAEKINILFCVGGDGSQRGAQAIYEEVTRRGLPISVVGIPKTIDNDIQYCQVTFGYASAIDAAKSVLEFAHNEATSAYNGIGLVKVMGRDAGFIAAGATLASQEVNFALIPEQRFKLDGPSGLLELLRQRILSRGHALIVVAEGAGQELFAQGKDDRDASGNIRYNDIGIYLRDRIKGFFAQQLIPLDLKYIDPSYIVRSIPANSYDALLCNWLARGAVHAAMAGKTGLVIGYWNNEFIHVPIPMTTGSKKQVDPESRLWMSVLAATGQPKSLA
jgi:6-phosphofructokinase 1